MPTPHGGSGAAGHPFAALLVYGVGVLGIILLTSGTTAP
jgi:hypothetical protein